MRAIPGTVTDHHNTCTAEEIWYGRVPRPIRFGKGSGSPEEISRHVESGRRYNLDSVRTHGRSTRATLTNRLVPIDR